MDAFFAAVEQLDNPRLRGKPVVVGGRPQSRGVVATASYEARPFGVHSAMSCAQAYRLCPQAVFVKPRFERYKEISAQIRDIFYDYTDLVEPLSLDEAYLDVTENKANNPSATLIAREIRQRIREETGLSASAGVAGTKFLAKIASDMDKPDGLTVIAPSKAQAFIDALPIGRFHGIGKATEKRMLANNITCGLDLRQRSELDLVNLFGKSGHHYFNIANGRDDRPVQPNRIRKSVGAEETFAKDLSHFAEMEAELEPIAANVERRLTRLHARGKTITLKVRYADFKRVTRSETMGAHIREAEVLMEICRRLLRSTQAEEKTVRLLGITVSKLDNEIAEEAARQLELEFENDWDEVFVRYNRE